MTQGCPNGETQQSEPLLLHTESIGMRGGTQGTETSKYLKEKKETSIPLVAASEEGGAQTTPFGVWGCRTSDMYSECLAEAYWKDAPE